ncbi:DUF2065 domain-containing protein [Iodobacter fluviatilis]|uniref:Uncharacterized protein conserved in bacteria (DUF2065) n=1 Tax=Iodobacter fluviatilis TaxID=537 RepID=A0A377Q809_9NEIS|nr:DUF2065 domain-containing protein [Iodobacter fluviatilis]TCU89505.1 hypothetical protein EV682_102417 [Iodobacter fluviatilis]STQ90875.1 Uncharacterized protein conserved in bacteria (DUF2065) [Iodobacter fluviatilis]
MIDSLLAAFALMLIFEGIMPFAFPAVWRSTMQKMAELDDFKIRLMGLGCLFAGLVLALLSR